MKYARGGRSSLEVLTVGREVVGWEVLSDPLPIGSGVCSDAVQEPKEEKEEWAWKREKQPTAAKVGSKGERVDGLPNLRA